MDNSNKKRSQKSLLIFGICFLILFSCSKKPIHKNYVLPEVTDSIYIKQSDLSKINDSLFLYLHKRTATKIETRKENFDFRQYKKHKKEQVKTDTKIYKQEKKQEIINTKKIDRVKRNKTTLPERIALTFGVFLVVIFGLKILLEKLLK